ncbi:hypothetical protein ACVARI_004841, partial [Escherichia coli]
KSVSWQHHLSTNPLSLLIYCPIPIEMLGKKYVSADLFCNRFSICSNFNNLYSSDFFKYISKSHEYTLIHIKKEANIIILNFLLHCIAFHFALAFIKSTGFALNNLLP